MGTYWETNGMQQGLNSPEKPFYVVKCTNLTEHFLYNPPIR